MVLGGREQDGSVRPGFESAHCRCVLFPTAVYPSLCAARKAVDLVKTGEEEIDRELAFGQSLASCKGHETRPQGLKTLLRLVRQALLALLSSQHGTSQRREARTRWLAVNPRQSPTDARHDSSTVAAQGPQALPSFHQTTTTIS
jgi:hypothetical protein